MNAEQSLKLARRFIELPQEKRRLFLERLRDEGIDFSLFPIPAGVETPERDALSYAQRRMWFLWQLDPQSAAYNLPSAVRLSGQLDEQALEKAFARLVERHETLRTVFPAQADDSLRQVPSTRPVSIEKEDLSHLSEAEQAQCTRAQAEQQAQQPFDLDTGPLLRVKLLKLGNEQHVLLLTLHHIVSDGWSMTVLIDEFSRFYNAELSGQAPQLPPLPIQYSDYALWQRSWLQAGEQERQLAYWQAKLGTEQPVLELPTDHSRPAIASQRGTRYEFELEASLADEVRGLARGQNLTLFMVLLGAFNVLLHRYTGAADIRVGVPIANRSRNEVEGLIGLFVNTQVLRSEFDGKVPVNRLLADLKETVMGAQGHQELPFEQLVEALKVERSLSHNPLFQVMYNHQPHVADIEALNTVSGLAFSQIEWQSRTTQFDLTLDTYEKGGKLQAALTYASDLFEPATIARMAEHWLNLLRAMVADPQQAIEALPMLGVAERQLIVSDWNHTAASYPLQQSIHRLIEAQVEKTPDAPALAFAEERLSYARLNARANRLAHKLIEQGVGPNVLVGIAVERSIEMVVGLLAILKAGGAYVPLDPEYPQDRLAYMLEDSEVALLLTQQALLPVLPVPEGLPVLALDQPGDWLQGYSDANPGIALDGENLAYVIYTSGSTGKPKGAGNRHSALTNRLCWMQEAYQLTAADTVLQKTPFSFDVSVWGFFWPLMTGARLVVAKPGDHRDPAKLVELINREQVSTLHFVPSMLQAFLQDADVASCAGLQRIVCSGEALPADAQQQVFAKLPNAGLYNLYGPTEAAIDVTHWTCVEEGRDSVPIGQPIANLGCYILDDNLEPVPAGVLGELYLAGEGLARGYHRRPALTAERFAASPYGNGARLYRSGDLVRYREGGVIEYAGRIDHQVKLRGLRIELGEIEARLLEHDNVREAAVLVIDGKQLVAYLVLAEESEGWRETLNAHLQRSLPEYMVPAQWLLLAHMPLSPNGKLDRKALPKPDASHLEQSYLAPGTAIERQLVDIWQSVLGLEQVGVTDNFFALGGDSIISIQVVSRARQAGLRFTPKDLFQYQTVQGLARVAQLGDSTLSIEQGPVTGTTPLLPFQQLFFATEIPERQRWNQSLLLKPSLRLDADLLEQALQALVRHHDALRLVFSETAHGWTADHRAVDNQQPVFWRQSVTDSAAVQAACEQAQASLNLAEGPLLRGLLLDLADGSQRVLLVIHHLVVDGVSWRVLLEDLQTACQQLQAGQPLKLPAKTTAFKTWAERLQQQAVNFTGELDLWRAQLDAPADLPCDNPGGNLQNRHALSVQTRLNKDVTRQLLQQAPAAYRTQVNDLLLTALARVICRWTGHDSTLVQLEGHGREDLFDDIDLSRTVGWFTSLFPVKLTPSQALGDSIKQVKEQLRALPVPRITFNYLGQFDSQFDEQALIVPASESAGSELSPLAPMGNWLVLNGQVYGGELSLGWSFSAPMFDPATIQHLADDYAAELAALIEHCLIQDNQGLTPSDFPLAALSQAQLDALPVTVGNIEDIYPLSPMQQGMLFHTLSDDGDDLYVNQLSLPVEGLEVERFRAAWQFVVQRHDILRTSFHWQGAQAAPIQLVQRQGEVVLQLLDWRDQPVDPARLAEVARQERARGFELNRTPLQRLLLIRTGEDQHQLIWTSHHILMDGWSSSQLFGEALQHYASGQVAGESGRYRDFIGRLQGQDQAELEAFWRGRLQALDAPTSLSQAMHPRHSEALPGHEALYTHWDAQQTAALLKHCRAQGITPNTLIQGAWLLVLQQYTGQRSVAFGATVAGRPEGLANADSMLGLFINTLPVIQTPEPSQRLNDWLAELQAYNLDLREHSHAPLADIQRWSGQGGQALLDSIIVFENYPIDRRLEEAQGGLRFGASANHDVTNFPMDLAVHLADELSIEYLFLRNCFSVEAVERIRQTMEVILQSMLATPHERLGNLRRLAPQQWQALQQWGAEPAEVHRQELLPAMIARHAQRSSQAPAVECAGQSLSYAQLEERANRLAHHLIAQGAGPEVLIGVALERSLDMLVALLAVLKSGAAYVPLDIDYPSERLAFMIEDSGLAQMISRSHLSERLPLPAGLPLVDLDGFEGEGYPHTAPVVQLCEHSLTYLIYTSGSTGVPKGVAVTHGPLSMHCQAIAELYEMEAGTRELHFMSFAFDGAHERWLTTLAHGGTLVLRDNELWTPEQTCQALQHLAIDIACFPPAYLKQVAEYVQASGVPAPAVRVYCLGGDAVPEQTLAQVRNALCPRYITNGYGPTETVVTPMLWKAANEEACAAAYAPIGRVVGQRSLWVLDDDLNPLPVGLAGQLHIGGYGVARGYHGRPSVTAERFIPDPFGAPGSRLYRSGDLVRLRESGVMDYVGRVDHQVKVRGFRIELGEIEACLRLQEGVSDAVVIAREGLSGKQLIGYVVGSGDAGLGERLKAELRATLPEYMVPAQIITLARMPISPNGKLDRKALPEPEFQAAHYQPPRTPEERLLAQIWAEVLQVEQVGIGDNFFELGGDSILSLQVISRARNHSGLKLEIKLRDLMRYQTIGNLFDQQVVVQPGETERVTQVAQAGAFALLPIQEWFFAEKMSEPHHFNQALMLRSREPLDAAALEQTLRLMLQQHDSLRLRFVQENGRWIQHYQPLGESLRLAEQNPLLWRREAADAAQLDVLANEAQRSLDLTRGPLLRGLLATLPGGEVRVLLVVHHLVIDAVSWRVLLQDLQLAYEACCQQRQPDLPLRTSSYRAWADGLAGHAPTLVEQELGYWRQQLERPGKDLPCDNPRGKNQVRYREETFMGLSETHTSQLLKQAPAVYGTQINDLLLTALSRVLCRWSEEPSVLVQLEGHGREDLFENLDLSRTLGWFTSMFPVRLAPTGAQDFATSIQAVRDQLAGVPSKGVGYGVLRYMADPAVQAQLAALPQARVTFNYLGQFDQTFDDQALLVPAEEGIGDTYSLEAGLGNWLELVGQVFDGKLSMRCIYSTRRYRKATIDGLMQQYQAELEALIEHCLEQAAV